MKLLASSYVLPISKDPIPEGAIVIEADKIVEVGSLKTLKKKYPEAKPEEFNNAVLMPGLVNVDTRMEFLSFERHGKDPQFIDWVLDYFEHRKKISPAERRANLAEGFKKLLQSGTTCVGDVGHYVGTLPSLSDCPLRLTLFPEILTSAEGEVMERYQASLGLVDEILAHDSPRLHAGLAPYSAYTLSRHLLKVLSRQAKQVKIPIKMHAAESFAEMQFFYESTGEIAEKVFPILGWEDSLPPAHRKTPIQFLDSIGFLQNGPILVGCLHLAEGDYPLLSNSGSKVVWRPRTQKYLKLGQLPIKKLKKAKVIVGLGTDGTGARHSLSLWDEMRAAEGECLPHELLTLATLGGAQVLGREQDIGSLEAGKKADLIAVRIPASLKLKGLEAHLVAHTTEREIHSVFIDGKKVRIT